MKPAITLNRDPSLTEGRLQHHWQERRGLTIHTILQLKDGTLLTGSGDAIIRRWKLPIAAIHKDADGETSHFEAACLQTYRKHSESISCLVELDYDEPSFVSGSLDGTLVRWETNNIESGGDSYAGTFKGHSGRVNCAILLSASRSIAINNNNNNGGKSSIIVSGSEDKTIKVWDIETMKCIRTMKEHPVLSLCELPNCPEAVEEGGGGGRLIASGCKDGKVRIWNLRTGKCVKTIRSTLAIQGVAGLILPGYNCMRDAPLLVTSEEGTVRLWNLSTGRSFYSLQEGRWGISKVIQSPGTGNFIVLHGGFGLNNPTISGWKASGEHLYTFELPSAVRASECITMLNDGSLACGLVDGSIEIWTPEVRYRHLFLR